MSCDHASILHNYGDMGLKDNGVTSLTFWGYVTSSRNVICGFLLVVHCDHAFISDCCIGLEQSAGVGPVVYVVASFPQQTENRTFCLVLQS